MVINIHIERVENLHITPETVAPLLEQLGGLDQSPLATDTPPPAVAEPLAKEPAVLNEEEDARAERLMARSLQADQVDATARVNFLRNVARHADPARGMEGFQTNHYRRPRNLSSVNTKHNSEKVKAEESLKLACGVCAVRQDCRLAEDIDEWLDLHPYKRISAADRLPGSLADRRPGSDLPPGVTESRTEFLRELKADPLAHCDPRVRRQAAT